MMEESKLQSLNSSGIAGQKVDFWARVPNKNKTAEDTDVNGGFTLEGTRYSLAFASYQ
jgi:hypothetical protein